MGPVYTPSMRNYEELIRAMHSERNTFAAGNVLDRAREVIENWKKQHDQIRELLDPHGINKEKPIATLVADAVALERAAHTAGQPLPGDG